MDAKRFKELTQVTNLIGKEHIKEVRQKAFINGIALGMSIMIIVILVEHYLL